MAKPRHKHSKASSNISRNSAFIQPVDEHKIESPTELIKQLLSLKGDLEICIPKEVPQVELEYDKRKRANNRKDIADNPFLSSDSLTSLIYKREEDEQRFAQELSDLDPIGLPLDEAIQKHKEIVDKTNQKEQEEDFEQQLQTLSNQIIKQTMDEYLPKIENIIRHRLTLAAQQLLKANASAQAK